MRRTRFITCGAAALGATLALAPAASAQGGRADLVISAATEAPQRQDVGTNWPQQVTAFNQGRRTAGRSVVRAYLSADQTFDAGDRRLDGQGRTPRLRRQRQAALTIRLTVPAGTPNGTYVVIICIDDDKQVRESSEANNCRPSGQRMGVGVSERGPIGAQGPAGPAGAAGADAIGPQGDLRPIARTTIPLGDPTVDIGTFPTANGQRPAGTATPDEGSTSKTTLMEYGPFDIVGSCKTVTNGDNQTPSTAPTPGGFGDEDGDEAKILVYVDTGSYTMQGGRHGPRMNIPAGEGQPGEDDVNGGEGKHMALAVNHDPDTGEDADDPTEEHAWSSNFRSTDAYIIHSSGTQLILRVWAGIDVFGVGNDSCIFGGVLEVVVA